MFVLRLDNRIVPASTAPLVNSCAFSLLVQLCLWWDAYVGECDHVRSCLVTATKLDQHSHNVETSNRTQYLPTGRVVGVLHRSWRAYVCTLQLDKASGTAASGSRFLFVPM